MVNRFNNLKISHVPCFTHNIQLVLKDGLLSQRSVIVACSVARALVGHFKHLSSATDRLVAIQIELGLLQHRLIQDVATRWSSACDMLRRRSEQRRILTLYASESIAGISLPSLNHWQLINKVIILLKEFSQLTLESCQADASILYSIPDLAGMSYFFHSGAVSTLGVNTMRDELVCALDKRFQMFNKTSIMYLQQLEIQDSSFIISLVRQLLLSV
jgi:hypothetical protein